MNKRENQAWQIRECLEFVVTYEHFNLVQVVDFLVIS